MHTRPSWIPSRAAIFRASCSIGSLCSRYRSGRPSFTAMALACEITDPLVSRRSLFSCPRGTPGTRRNPAVPWPFWTGRYPREDHPIEAGENSLELRPVALDEVSHAAMLLHPDPTAPEADSPRRSRRWLRPTAALGESGEEHVSRLFAGARSSCAQLQPSERVGGV